MKSLANQANTRLIITTFYFYYTNASQKCLQKYEIDLGSGQNHTDTVSLDLSKAPLNFRNILKLSLLLKSHDWRFDTRSIHKGFKASQSSVSRANITSSHNQGNAKHIREFEVCDFQT